MPGWCQDPLDVVVVSEKIFNRLGAILSEGKRRAVRNARLSGDGCFGRRSIDGAGSSFSAGYALRSVPGFSSEFGPGEGGGRRDAGFAKTILEQSRRRCAVAVAGLP
jgi:hypothetical protein